MSMKMRKLASGLLLVAAFLAGMHLHGGFPPPAQAAPFDPPNIYADGETIAVTGASQRIQTDLMQTKLCTSWIFDASGSAATFYINPNNSAVAAVVSAGTAGETGNGQWIVPAGAVLEVENQLIKQFRVIGSGADDLVMRCGCHD
jgi:hypothetical protein